MSLATTAAFISTVNADHTIRLPKEIPVGTKVAVVLMPVEEQTVELTERRARFEKVMSAIRAAITDGFSAPAISDEELNARIKRASQLPGHSR